MLILTRRVNEEIVIDAGERIIVRITEIGGGKVRLGFIARPDVKIHRREVQDAIEGLRDVGGEGGGA